jgi:F0F1-type ATP synthase gamma subunit
LLRNFPDKNKVGIILITTNRGLVGSFNTNLLFLFSRLLLAPLRLQYYLFHSA